MEWYDFIGNYCFPIGMCLIMFWKMNKQDESHASQNEKFADAIENNTNSITALTELIRTKL